MTDLSPAAQAVLDAAEDDCIHPTDLHKIVAAALRAAADQVVPGSPNMSLSLLLVRHRLHAIAAELEAHGEA
jgi:hypothetical protein